MKRIFSVIFCISVALAFSFGAAAGSVDPKGDSLAIARMREKMAEIKKHRPVVGLVLSGGGAKGAAHVGALKYIEELGIPVDMVLGTSIGGLVGGLYSLGYDVEDIEGLVRNMDWEWALGDGLSREYTSFSDNKYKDKYLISIPFYYEPDYYNMLLAEEYRFDDLKKHESFRIGADDQDSKTALKRNLLGSLPSGFVYGQNVSNLISSLTIGYQDSLDFSEFPIPYACVATDLVSGKAKIWCNGKMNDAMRSTMSIPGMFAPVRVDGMVLVDGGLRDNYPTSLARAMGADIIIGVDLAQPQRSYLQVNNLADILVQGVDMMMRDSYEANVNVPDVKIKPEISEYNMMSFNKKAIDTILVRGYRAALSQDSLLREVAAKTSGIYEVPRKPKAFDFHTDSLTIAEVDVVGVLPREEMLLKSRIDIVPGQKISRKDLDHIIARLYGTQAYDYVTYELLGEKEPFKLILKCRKGPVHQLGIGLRADTEEIVSVLLNVGLNAHKLHGNTFDLTGKISANPYLRLGWSYHGPDIPTLNATASVRWTDLDVLNLWEHNLGFKYLHAKQEFYLSQITWRQFDFNAGLRNELFHLRDFTNSSVPGDYSFDLRTSDYISIFAAARMDTFDDGYFPARGVKAQFNYSWTPVGFTRNFKNFHTLYGGVRFVAPFGESFALVPYVSTRIILGQNIPVAYFNAIGGSLAGRYVDQQIPFIGVTNLWAMRNILTLVGVDFRVKVHKNHYFTGIMNYVRDCDDFNTYLVGPGYVGAGLEYAYNTIFGPLKANIHWSDLSRKVGFYISAGYYF